MVTRRSTGTRIILHLFFVVAITIGLLALVASIPRFVRMGERAIKDRRLSNNGIILIDQDAPRSDGTVGDTVGERQFLEVMFIDGGTTLMKESFIKSASGRTVTWRLQVKDIKFGDDGSPTGEMVMRYELRSGNSSHGSSVPFEVIFRADQADQLLTLRQNDIATVKGTLKFDQSFRQITNSRLVNQDGTDASDEIGVEQE